MELKPFLLIASLSIQSYWQNVFVRDYCERRLQGIKASHRGYSDLIISTLLALADVTSDTQPSSCHYALVLRAQQERFLNNTTIELHFLAGILFSYYRQYSYRNFHAQCLRQWAINLRCVPRMPAWER